MHAILMTADVSPFLLFILHSIAGFLLNHVWAAEVLLDRRLQRQAEHEPDLLPRSAHEDFSGVALSSLGALPAVSPKCEAGCRRVHRCLHFQLPRGLR